MMLRTMAFLLLTCVNATKTDLKYEARKDIPSGSYFTTAGEVVVSKPRSPAQFSTTPHSLALGSGPFFLFILVVHGWN